MKKPFLSLFALLGFVFAAGAQNPVDLPIRFDSTNVNYALVDFGGNVSSIVSDPAGGTNQVLKVDKTAGAQTWAGTTIGGTGLATAIPFAPGSTVITMRVYSPDSGIVVRLKAEDPNDPTRSVETNALTTGVNTWETLTFDFANQASGTAAINYSYVYGKLSAFFNFGIDGATAGAKTYYCDDIEFVPGQPLPINITFQVSNPDSTPVFVFGSWSGWSNWPGTPMTAAGPGLYSVTLQLNPSTSYEYLFVNGGTPVAETLDPSSPCTNGNAQYTNRTLITGTTDATLCSVWDSCASCNAVVLSQVDLPVTFDDTTVNYALNDFGGNISSIVTDPGGGSNKVCRIEKSNTAQTWAGTTIGNPLGFASGIPFAANATQMTMRVYSPDSGTVIRMKAEDPSNAAISVETDAVTTTSNAWETLTYDFANQATGTAPISFSNNYGKLSVFFNFGVDGATAGTKVYHFDDVTLLPPGPSQVTVTFQVQNPDSAPVFLFGSWSGWSNFPGTLMTSVGNGVYSVDIPLTANTGYEYKFVNGGTVPTLETLDPSWPCTNGNAQYTNRVLALGTNDTTLCAVWDSCSSCTPIVMSPVDLPVTFDDNMVNYDLIDFGGNASMIEPDPAGGTNLVCKTIKPNTALSWAGTTIGGTVGFANPVPFAAGATTMSMRIYSPDAGIPVRMKVEDPSNGAISVETEAVTTTNNAWETLVFDFASPVSGTPPLNFANNYQKLSVFFNFGTDGATAGTKTYYFDDVQFGGTLPTITITFQVESPDSLPVYVFGSWSNWSNFPGTQLTAATAPNTYETSITLNANSTYEYLFVNGGAPVTEDLDPAGACTNGNAQYTNRTLITGSANATICSVWGNCTACGTVGIAELLNDRYSVTVFPEGIRINADAPSSIREIVVYDFLGKVLYSNEKEVTVNTLLPFNHGSAAMLVVKFVTDQGIAVYKVPAIK